MSAIDFGPLEQLIGDWQGDRGKDVSPAEGEAGHVDADYRERLLVDVVGDVTNAGTQTLAVVRYHQVVTRLSDGEVFHDEMGYYHYDAATGLLSCTFCIPRGVAVHAAGIPEQSAEGWRVVLKHVGIAQSSFMAEEASTRGFERHLQVAGKEVRYRQQIDLGIYGRVFEHSDENTLTLR
ncbi:MAG: heme-binding beta-barrel domain-containing protein [Pseudomonadota bacterium]